MTASSVAWPRHRTGLILLVKASLANRWRPALTTLHAERLPLWRVLLAKNAAEAALVSAGLWFVSSRLPVDFQWIPTVVALALVLLESTTTVLSTDAQVFGRHRSAFWSPQWVGDGSYHLLLVDAAIAEWLVNSAGMLAPTLVLVGLRLGAGGVWCCLGVLLLGQLVFWVKCTRRTTAQRRVALAWYAVATATSVTATWLVFTTTVLLLTMSRTAASAHGVSEEFVTATNRVLETQVLSALAWMGSHVTRTSFEPLILPAIAVASLTLGALAVLRRGEITPAGRGQWCSGYVRFVTAHVASRLPWLSRRDLLMMSRTPPAWNHTDLNLLLPFETWMLLGANAALLPVVHNPWIASILILIELYVLGAAVLRGFVGHYRQQLEFTQDASLALLFRQASSARGIDLLRAKALTLIVVAGPVLVLNVVVLATSVALTLGSPSWVLSANIAAAPVLIVLTVGWVLRGPYDTFRWAMARGGALTLDLEATDLRDVAGATVIQRLGRTAMSLLTYALTLALLLGAALGVIRGPQWGVVFGVVAVAILGGLVLSNLATFRELAARGHTTQSRGRSRIVRLVPTIACVLVELAALALGAASQAGRGMEIHPTHLDLWALWQHNVGLGALIVVAGLLTFGLAGVGLSCVTFFNLGATTSGVVATYGWGPVLTGVLPHALVELTAITVMVLLGFESLRLFVGLQAGERIPGRRTALRFALTFAIGVLLFTVSAFIETGISHV